MFITDKNELKNYGPTKRIWQCVPSLAGTKNGRLFCTFYTGSSAELFGNYCVLLLSDDDGKTWLDPFAAVVPENPENGRFFDGNVWIDPQGRLWYFCSYTYPHAVYAFVCDNPDEDVLKWHEPVIIGHDVMMNKPTVTSNGDWLLPIAVWKHGLKGGLDGNREDTDPEPRGSFLYRSSDSGKSFVKMGGADIKDREFDEHMFVENPDESIDVYVRTIYGIGKSTSYDGGKNWSEGTDSGLGGPCSRFFIRRLSSGNLLLINHVNVARYQRTNLAAMLSSDNGKTWSAPLMLDSRNSVSYPDGFESLNGFIYICYDRERGGFKKTPQEALADAREILFAKFTEADILAGKLITEGSSLENIISKLGEYDGDAYELFKYIDERS